MEMIGNTGNLTASRGQDIIGTRFQLLKSSGLLEYITPSATYINKKYIQKVFPEAILEYLQNYDATIQHDYNQEAKDILDGNLRVHCTCPAFSHWGSSYLLSQENAKLGSPENRPITRNFREDLNGFTCKHLYKALQLVNGEVDRFARYLKSGQFNLNAARKRYNDMYEPVINDIFK
jgi:hypothetical protein